MLQVIALAERGTLYDPGPCMYMDKLAVGPRVDPATVSLDKSVADNLKAVSEALDKPVSCGLPLVSLPLALASCAVTRGHTWGCTLADCKCTSQPNTAKRSGITTPE